MSNFLSLKYCKGNNNVGNKDFNLINAGPIIFSKNSKSISNMDLTPKNSSRYSVNIVKTSMKNDLKKQTSKDVDYVFALTEKQSASTFNSKSALDSLIQLIDTSNSLIMGQFKEKRNSKICEICNKFISNPNFDNLNLKSDHLQVSMKNSKTENLCKCDGQLKCVWSRRSIDFLSQYSVENETPAPLKKEDSYDPLSLKSIYSSNDPLEDMRVQKMIKHRKKNKKIAENHDPMTFLSSFVIKENKPLNGK